jgi:hypothetical protein
MLKAPKHSASNGAAYARCSRQDRSPRRSNRWARSSSARARVPNCQPARRPNHSAFRRLTTRGPTDTAQEAPVVAQPRRSPLVSCRFLMARTAPAPFDFRSRAAGDDAQTLPRTPRLNSCGGPARSAEAVDPVRAHPPPARPRHCARRARQPLDGTDNRGAVEASARRCPPSRPDHRAHRSSRHRCGMRSNRPRARSTHHVVDGEGVDRISVGLQHLVIGDPVFAGAPHGDRVRCFKSP